MSERKANFLVVLVVTDHQIFNLDAGQSMFVTLSEW